MSFYYGGPGTDPATQTTLVQVLAKLPSDPATGAKQDDIIAAVDSAKTATVNAVAAAQATLIVGLIVPAVPATATITFNDNPLDGETFSIGEQLFEFDSGVGALGTIALFDGQVPANPLDGDVIVIGDGVHDPVFFEFDAGVAATGTIAFTDGEIPVNPTPGETITLNDGVQQPTVLTFVAADPGPLDVLVGQDADETMVNLIIVANGSGVNITLAPGNPPDHTCSLENNAVGEDGNQPIETTGVAIVVTGMAGGVNMGEDVQPGHVGVRLIGVAEETIVELIDAINGVEDLNITASPNDPADHACNLVNGVPGEAGNVPINVEAATNVVVTGMAGGVNPGDDVGPMAIGVPLGENAEQTRDNSIVAIVGSELALAVPTGPDGIALTWPIAGTVGNGVNVASSSQVIDTTSFAGGLDATTLRTIEQALTLGRDPLTGGVTTVDNTSQGDAVPLTVQDIACRAVRVMAPSAENDGGVNEEAVFVAATAEGAPSHAQALALGVRVATGNWEGELILCSNANQLYAAGLADGDAIRWLPLR